MRAFVLACVALLAICAVSVTAEEVLKRETFRVGPMTVTPGEAKTFSHSIHRPAVHEDIAIRSWGKWTLVTESGEEIPRPDLYLHHSFYYGLIGDTSSGAGTSEFVTGSSNERDSWGVEGLQFPYRQILKANSIPSGSVHMVNLLKDRSQTFYLQYEVEYTTDIQPETRPVHSVIFSNGANIPGNGGRGSLHFTQLNNAFSFDGRVVYLNAHLHQGGRRMRLVEESTGNVLCDTKPVYSLESTCFYDCAEACTTNEWSEGYHKTTPVCITDIPVKAGQNYLSLIDYDNSCSWHGTHSWWFMFVAHESGVYGSPTAQA